MINALLMAFICGIGIGGFYFAGLWWTVRRLQTSHRPGLLALASFLVRVGSSGVAFFFILDGHWERLLVGLLGFMVMRSIVVRRLRADPSNSFSIKKGVPT
jgi:F1F0 ATPase subunit 2